MAFLTRRNLLPFLPRLRAAKDMPKITSSPRLAFGELPEDEPIDSDPITGWHKDAKRVGVIGVKLGMTRDWDDISRVHALTALHVCIVTSFYLFSVSSFLSPCTLSCLFYCVHYVGEF